MQVFSAIPDKLPCVAGQLTISGVVFIVVRSIYWHLLARCSAPPLTSMDARDVYPGKGFGKRVDLLRVLIGDRDGSQFTVLTEGLPCLKSCLRCFKLLRSHFVPPDVGGLGNGTLLALAPAGSGARGLQLTVILQVM